MVKLLAIALLLTACSAQEHKGFATVQGDATPPAGAIKLIDDCRAVIAGGESSAGMTIDRCRALWPNL